MELPEFRFFIIPFAGEWSERKNERTNERKKIIYAFFFTKPRETNQPNAMLYENRLRCQRVFFGC